MIGMTPRQPNPRATPTPKRLAPFAPLPWQVVPWRDRAPLLLLTGAAGGASRAWRPRRCTPTA